MKKALLALALLVRPASVRAEEGIAAPTAREMSPCACAAKKRCWSLVMTADAKMVGLREQEIEGALPNRFFPATLTFVLHRPTEDGHFLIVKCGSARRACTDKRDVLEERVIKSGLLASLPIDQTEGKLFDPATFKLTAAGEKTFDSVKQCRKALLEELAAVVLGSGSN